jgi:hypothetical protein
MNSPEDRYLPETPSSLGNVFRSSDIQKIEEQFEKFEEHQKKNKRPFWGVLDHSRKNGFYYDLSKSDVELKEEERRTIASWIEKSEEWGTKRVNLGKEYGSISGLKFRDLRYISYRFWKEILSEKIEKKNNLFRATLEDDIEGFHDSG